MSRTRRLLRCTPDQVFAVLADGWSYATWVVGAARIRTVDDGWPAEGTRIHHSVGGWPLLLSDVSAVEEVVPGRALQLRVRAWPGGAGRVRLELDPVEPAGAPGGGATATMVTMTEDAVAGPALLVPPPVRHAMLAARNREALRRLAHLAEGRAARQEQGAGAE